MFIFDKIVLAMAAVRFISAATEFSVAMLMLYFNRVEVAFKLNAVLALVGPTAMITVTSLGLVGLAGKVSALGMVCIVLGVAMIFFGVNKL